MVPQRHISFPAGLLELLKLWRFPRVVCTPRYCVDEVLRENKGYSLPIDAKFFLVVPQKMTEIYVEDLAVLVDHDVVRVPVTDAEDERRDAVAGAGGGERVDGLLHLVLVLVLDPLVQLGAVQL